MRANIEENAWKRIYKIALHSGFSVREVTGTVACLWANSQEAVKTHGTREQIVEWADLFKLSTEEIDKWIRELEFVHFISCGKDGVYKIHGNEEQLKSAASRISRASKGGQALRKKMRDLDRLQKGLKPTTGSDGEASRGPIQVKAIQINTKQFNSTQGEAAVEKFSADPIFSFLDGMAQEELAVDHHMIKAVAQKVHDEVHLRASRTGVREAVPFLIDTIKTIDGLKWFLFAAWSYRSYCLENKVKKVFGFKRFVDEWVNWIPQEFFKEGA